ncbi:MAG: hypothetical protein PHX51_08505 [Clostridia bacterium]|nr:hypothetical protein [Clostridia bacterium]
MRYDRIECACGRTKNKDSKQCVWCGIKTEDCVYDEVKRKLTKKEKDNE